uniref:Uncharacterized protein n=1 Tax=Arundo donax TaxID=35708 RepID=A0A0A9H2P4_ARUDO
MLEEYDQIFDDIEDGSYCSDSYTDSDSGDGDKEYSTDNDVHEEDGSYDSGEDDIAEGLDDNSYGGSKCDNDIRIDNTDEKVHNGISGTACNDNDKVVQPPVKAVRTEHGVSREDNNQISSLPQVDDTSQMERSSPSLSKQESCESNGSTDHIQKPNARSSSSSRAKFMEKTSSSSNERKRTLLGRT